MSADYRDDTIIECESNYNEVYASSLWAHCTYLCRDAKGRYYLHEVRGPALGMPGPRQYLSRLDAIRWIVDHAKDGRTSEGYTWDEALALVDAPEDTNEKGAQR